MNRKLSLLLAVVMVAALFAGVTVMAASNGEPTVATVSDQKELMTALADYSVNEITLEGRIPLTSDIAPRDVHGDKTIYVKTTESAPHHFTVADGLTIDFGTCGTVVLDGQGSFGGVSVPGGASYTLKNVTVKNCKTGDVIEARGNLVLENVVVTDNESTNNNGGVVIADGTVNMTNCVFSGNQWKLIAIYAGKSGGKISNSTISLSGVSINTNISWYYTGGGNSVTITGYGTAYSTGTGYVEPERYCTVDHNAKPDDTLDWDYWPTAHEWQVPGQVSRVIQDDDPIWGSHMVVQYQDMYDAGSTLNQIINRYHNSGNDGNGNYGPAWDGNIDDDMWELRGDFTYLVDGPIYVNTKMIILANDAVISRAEGYDGPIFIVGAKGDLQVWHGYLYLDGDKSVVDVRSTGELESYYPDGEQGKIVYGKPEIAPPEPPEDPKPPKYEITQAKFLYLDGPVGHAGNYVNYYEEPDVYVQEDVFVYVYGTPDITKLSDVRFAQVAHASELTDGDWQKSEYGWYIKFSYAEQEPGLYDFYFKAINSAGDESDVFGPVTLGFGEAPKPEPTVTLDSAAIADFKFSSKGSTITLTFTITETYSDGSTETVTKTESESSISGNATKTLTYNYGAYTVSVTVNRSGSTFKITNGPTVKLN